MNEEITTEETTITTTDIAILAISGAAIIGAALKFRSLRKSAKAKFDPRNEEIITEIHTFYID
jgi:hypothetical protein